MASRNPSKFPRYEREIHYYRAPEDHRWPNDPNLSYSYDYYLVPVARSEPEYKRISPSPVIDDPRLRLSIVSSSSSEDGAMDDTPSTSYADVTPPGTSEIWNNRDPRLMKNPYNLKYATKLPKLAEPGPYPTSFHYYYSSHEPNPSTDSFSDQIHAPLFPLSQTQLDKSPPIQKWSKVTNLNQIPTSSQADAYRTRKSPKQRHLNLMPRPPTPLPTSSEQLIWTDLDQIPLPLDPKEIF